MKTELHLHFDGSCKEAFEFYADVFGGRIESMLTYGETPAGEHVPHEHRERIVHAGLKMGEIEIAGADILQDYNKPSGFNILMQFNNRAEAQQIFEQLAREGQVTMPLQKTFWSPCYGMVTDRFNIPWEINCTS